MKRRSRLAVPLALAIAFGAPLLAGAQTGASCTGNGQGTCNSGYTCVVIGEGYNQCSPDNALPAGTVSPLNNNTVTQNSNGAINLSYVQGYKDSILTIVNSILVPILIAISFIVFLWGVYKSFIWNGDSDTERAKGRQFVLWGIIGLVVIFSVWGLVALVSGTLSLPSGVHPKPPTI